MVGNAVTAAGSATRELEERGYGQTVKAKRGRAGAEAGSEVLSVARRVEIAYMRAASRIGALR